MPGVEKAGEAVIATVVTMNTVIVFVVVAVAVAPIKAVTSSLPVPFPPRQAIRQNASAAAMQTAAPLEHQTVCHAFDDVLSSLQDEAQDAAAVKLAQVNVIHIVRC